MNRPSLLVVFSVAVVACVGDDSVAPKDSGADTTAPADGGGDVVAPPEGGADAGPWTPAALDGDGSLALWLEASSGNVTVSNGQVEKWADLSKNHNDATNTTGGPTVDASAVNGHDALTFGADVILTVADGPSVRFGTDQVLVFAVGKDTAPGPLGFFSKAQTKIGIPGTTFYQGFELIGTQVPLDAGNALVPVARFAQDIADAGTSTVQSIESDAPLFDDGKFHIVGARRPNAGVLTLYADGVVATNPATEDDDVSVPGIDVKIGALHYGKTIQAVTGDIAEIIVVHAPIIADQTVTDVMTYLKAKYAL